VIERLQQECDKESRRILTELIQRRNLDQIVRQVNFIKINNITEHENICLYQVDEALRGGAPLHTVASSASLVSMAVPGSQTHRRTGSTGTMIEQEHHKIPDPRDLDHLLGELSIANARAELYMRFLRRRITVSPISNNTKKSSLFFYKNYVCQRPQNQRSWSFL